MSLTLYFHPLSSFCHKVLIALYENDTPFTPQLVNLQDEGERTAFQKMWPIGKFPLLRDEARDWTVNESSIIIEYLDQHFPGRTRFIPDDPAISAGGPHRRDAPCGLARSARQRRTSVGWARPAQARLPRR